MAALRDREATFMCRTCDTDKMANPCGRLLHQRAGQMSERASEASAWGRVHRGAGDGVGLDEPPGASGVVALH